MIKEEKIKEVLFDSVDLSNLRKWKGGFSFEREKYFEILKEREKKGENIFCAEFCTGCGRILPLQKDLALDFYHDIFSGIDHPLLDSIPNLDKTKQYIETDVCDNCIKDFTHQEAENKSLSIVGIPTIKNI